MIMIMITAIKKPLIMIMIMITAIKKLWLWLWLWLCVWLWLLCTRSCTLLFNQFHYIVIGSLHLININFSKRSSFNLQRSGLNIFPVMENNLSTGPLDVDYDPWLWLWLWLWAYFKMWLWFWLWLHQKCNQLQSIMIIISPNPCP